MISVFIGRTDKKDAEDEYEGFVWENIISKRMNHRKKHQYAKHSEKIFRKRW